MQPSQSLSSDVPVTTDDELVRNFREAAESAKVRFGGGHFLLKRLPSEDPDGVSEIVPEFIFLLREHDTTGMIFAPRSPDGEDFDPIEAIKHGAPSSEIFAALHDTQCRAELQVLLYSTQPSAAWSVFPEIEAFESDHKQARSWRRAADQARRAAFACLRELTRTQTHRHMNDLSMDERLTRRKLALEGVNTVLRHWGASLRGFHMAFPDLESVKTTLGIWINSLHRVPDTEAEKSRLLADTEPSVAEACTVESRYETTSGASRAWHWRPRLTLHPVPGHPGHHMDLLALLRDSALAYTTIDPGSIADSFDLQDAS